MSDLRQDKGRVEDAVMDAMDAFWNSIAENYPEITTGDLDPGTSIDLTLSMENAVDKWLMWNQKEE
jgi:hypothetical protein